MSKHQEKINRARTESIPQDVQSWILIGALFVFSALAVWVPMLMSWQS
jgi:hypothetical protein